MTNAAQASWKKYIRTLQHREDLAECLKQYAALQPYETYQSGDGEYERWRPTVPPPLEIAILAGEAFYQTRSILDHLFYALVERREGPECPDDDADWKKVQFPIRIERPKGSSHTRVPREDFKNPNWMWISEDAYRFIESVQPYHPRQPIATALKRLAEFSRIDKHRHLSLLMVGLDLRDIAQTASGEWVTLHGGLFHADQELTPLSEPPDLQDAPRRITREITPVVAFNEPTIGAPETARVQEIVFEVVEQCNWVAGRLREFLIPNGQPGPHNWPVI